MDKQVEELSSNLIGNYAEDAWRAVQSQQNLVTQLLRHKKLPENGWSELTIEYFLHQLALMDSNNFNRQVGVGEREGRVICPLVSRRNYRFSHGIGRSGDVTAVQPKAAGSSLANQLCNALILDAIHIAGLIPVIIDPVKSGDQLETDLEAFKKYLEKFGNTGARVGRLDAFVQSTDKNFMVPVGGAVIAGFDCNIIEGIAKTYPGRASGAPSLDVLTTLLWLGASEWKTMLRKRKEMFTYLRDQLEPVLKKQRERILTSKNNQISLDKGNSSCLFGLCALSKPDSNNFYRRFEAFGLSHFHSLTGLQVSRNLWMIPDGMRPNPPLLRTCAMISAISLYEFDELLKNTPKETLSVTELGSMLFKRCCTGARVVAKSERKVIEGHEFVGWGSSCSQYPGSYLNVAGAIGMTKDEVDTFVGRLEKTFVDFEKRIKNSLEIEMEQKRK